MIRYFEQKDREKFFELSHSLHNSDAVLFEVSDEAFGKTFDLVLENSPYAAAYMIEADGQSVGFGLLTFSYSNEMGGLIVWLEELYIIEEFRSRGLGKEFLEFLKNKYKGEAAYIRLEVTDSNKDATRLYENMGYKELLYKQMLFKL